MGSFKHPRAFTPLDLEIIDKVYAINVWERETTPEACKAKATEYWKAQNFTMPLLLDTDNKLISELGLRR